VTKQAGLSEGDGPKEKDGMKRKRKPFAIFQKEITKSNSNINLNSNK
jgi:hypothetical protein